MFILYIFMVLSKFIPMTYLGYTTTELIQKGAIHTASEIAQQPSLWKKI